MSQIYRSTSAGPSPPDVPTDFETQDGTATPIANVLIVSADDTRENDVDGLRTVGGGSGDPATASNEVRVELTNRIQGTATSTNGSTEDLITFTLDADNPKVYRFNVDIAGRSTAGNFTGEGIGYTILSSAKSDGAGTAAVISTAFQDVDEDNNLNSAILSFVASGNDVIFRVTGIADETISYGAVGYYVEI